MDLPHLRRFRQRAVMSQDQLAEQSGVARDTISKLETGRRKAYPSTIRKLATGLEVQPQILLGGVEYVEDPQESEEPIESKNSGASEKEGKKIGF
ncbi:MAG: helix-turn-helix transcriptional regulator [Rubrobacteraceae bacterium]